MSTPQIQTIGIVGAGTMGNGIAQACATKGFKVVIVDISEAAVAKGLATVSASLDRLIKKEKITAEDKAAALALITGSTAYEDLTSAQLVIEAATENEALKIKILQQLDGMLPAELRDERRARFMEVAEQVSTERLKRRVGATMQVLIDSAPALGRKGGIGRSYADAPEIDGVVRLLPPEKASKTLKVGEFTRARVVATQGHDLVAVPI